MTLFPSTAVERTMKVQEVILSAAAKKITWIQAAQILRISDRSMRRWKWRYEHHGYDGLFDRRRQRPSPKRAPMVEVERILGLYRDRYAGFNMRHFHEKLKTEHEVTLSYSFVKAALQTAGLVAKKVERGRHRKRRERKDCLGEMLHIDGSPHEWLTLCPGEKQVMIAVVDDATSQMLYGQLFEEESTESIMTALRFIFEKFGLPLMLYSDRASWAFHTPVVGGKVDKLNLTQVGRALDRLGVDHQPAYSPQARGRSERLNRTLQDRLINELRLAGIKDVMAANRYLNEVYIPQHNKRFAVEAKASQNLFVSCKGVDLNQILCEECERVVGKDNVVRFENLTLQVEKQTYLSSCAGRRVLVRRHLDQTISLWLGAKSLGIYDSQGLALNTQTRKRKKAA
jgi:transposase